MNETVWFLSAVINGRFSVTSIIASDEKDAVRQAQEYFIHTALVPLSDMLAEPIMNNTHVTDAYMITSDCFVASLIKA